MKSLVQIATLSLLTLSAVTSRAQISVGLQAGYYSTAISIEAFSRDELKEIGIKRFNSFAFGVPVELALSEHFALQPELNFVRTGLRSEIEDFGSKVSLNVLEVPLLAKAGFDASGIRLSALLGPSFGYILSGRSQSDAIDIGGFQIPATDEKIEFGDEDGDLRRLGIFGVAGVQFGLPLASARLVIDGRYRFQLNTNEKGDVDDEDRSRFNSISATAGVLFPLGG